MKYQPDFVVLGFFANDLEDNIRTGLFSIGEQGELVPEKKKYVPGVGIQNFIYALPVTQWLSEHSYLYSFAFNTTWSFFKSLLLRKNKKKAFEYAIATQSTFSDYQIELTSKLIKRMSEVCKTNGVKFIVVDIPSSSHSTKVRSSIPPSLAPIIQTSSDANIDSKALLSEYAGVVELHVPHGHNHISEFTHMFIGLAVGESIKSMIEKKLVN